MTVHALLAVIALVLAGLSVWLAIVAFRCAGRADRAARRAAEAASQAEKFIDTEA